MIDPGEMPPSRPTRVQKDFAKQSLGSSLSGSSASSKSDDNNKIFKKPLSRTIKLDYKLDADDEPGDLLDDDPEYGETHIPTRPSPARLQHENARLFAEAMLNETERRQSKRNLLPGNPHSPVRSFMNSVRGIKLNPREASPLRKAVGLDDEYDELVKARRQYYRKRKCQRIGVLVAMVAIMLAFVIAVIRGLEERIVTPSMSERMSATVNLLSEKGISDQKDLLKESTPQYKAAYWMANTDAEPLSVPSSSDDQNVFRFVQRYVLAVLYHSLNGNNWINGLGFLSGVHECSWYEEVPDENGDLFAVGVTCNENLHVDNLLIPSNNLKGTIPDEIRHLKKLDFLSLKHNDLSGTIPSSLKELTLLDYLDLKYNRMIGSIPHFLGDLQRLQVLGLSKNQFSGSLPGSFGTLRLKTLGLDDNMLTGDLAPISMMNSLEYVYVEDNEFSGKLDHGMLVDLKGLKEADLSGNQLEGASIPTHIFTLPLLKALDLSDNDITGSLPDTMPENNVLEYLSLRRNAVSSAIPNTISNLRALTHLDLESNAFTGELPKSLGDLKDLSYLFLGINPLTGGSIPDELKSLTALRELSMEDIQLVGNIPEWIGDTTGLRLLDLRHNELTGSIQVDFSKLKHLEYLMLSDNKLTGEIPVGLGSQTDLEIVSLHHNGLIGEAGGLCTAKSEIQVLTTDCGEITCDCCDECCDSDNCFQDVVWNILEILENDQTSWEGKFRRADYSFNPHILIDKEPRGGAR